MGPRKYHRPSSIPELFSRAKPTQTAKAPTKTGHRVLLTPPRGGVGMVKGRPLLRWPKGLVKITMLRSFAWAACIRPSIHRKDTERVNPYGKCPVRPLH